MAKFLRVESLTTGTNRSVNGRVRRPGWNTKGDGKKEGRIYLIRIIAIRGDRGISINLRRSLRGRKCGLAVSGSPQTNLFHYLYWNREEPSYATRTRNEADIAERMAETLKREGSKRKGDKVGSTSSDLET